MIGNYGSYDLWFCLIVSALMVETSKTLLYLYYYVYGPDVAFK